jgi:hypothetical protein
MTCWYDGVQSAVWAEGGDMIGKTRGGTVRFAVPVATAACVAAGLWLLLGGTGAAPGRAAVASSKSVEASVAPLRASAPSVELSFSSPQKQTVTKAIEQIDIFDRVLGTNPQLTDADRRVPEPDPATWRVLSLRMAKVSGKLLHIKLARPLTWIDQVGAMAGRSLDMDLPEMGAVGVADVLAIDPCPPLGPGKGNVVTGTFAHEADDNLITLRLSNDIDPIGVTDNHPFWSEDRLDFVPSGALKPGERVRTRNGTAGVLSLSKRPSALRERVYNLEVHGAHVYQVTAAGVLVHNDCVGRANAAAQRNGGTAGSTEGHYNFPNRRAAVQAASEIAGNLGRGAQAIRLKDFRGAPWNLENSNQVIGRISADGLTGWRDDFLGHANLGMGPHVNTWVDGIMFHLWYP